MRRLLAGVLIAASLAAALLTCFCGYILIEDLSGPAQIGSPTYKLETFEP